MICRFDYIVRDCRACGLGCSFEFPRFFYSLSSSVLNLFSIGSLLNWYPAKNKTNIKLEHFPGMILIHVNHLKVNGDNASYGWWDLLSRQGLLVSSVFYTKTFSFDLDYPLLNTGYFARSYHSQVVFHPCWSLSHSLYSSKSKGMILDEFMFPHIVFFLHDDMQTFYFPPFSSFSFLVY